MMLLVKNAIFFTVLWIGMSKASQLTKKYVDGSEIAEKMLKSTSRNNVGMELYDLVILPTPTLNNGNTTGKKIKSHRNRDICSFQGIPYVDKPDRFTIPGKVKSDYGNPLEALELGNKCPQVAKTKINGALISVGNDDCLFINVYVPFDSFEESDLLPVMVFIHGGQFIHGDASSYMPTRLLDEDVVLVTFHYRLGALAFYSSREANKPGNLALYDQNAALKWVNKYIGDFGGDKDKVTLFGQDVGAVSALYHLISGNSKYTDENGAEISLFHAIIAQSGSPLDPFAFDYDPVKTSKDIAEEFKCNGDPANVEICMADVSIEDLVFVADALAEKRAVSIPYFAPGIEQQNGILNDNPFNLMQNGNYEKLPIMLGTCGHEGSYVFGEFYSYYLAPEGKINDTEYLKFNMVPELIELAGITDPLEFVPASLYNTYLNNTDRTKFSDVTPGMIDMTGALFYKAGTLETAKLLYLNYAISDIMPRSQEADIFLYSFEYKGEDSSFPYHFWGVDYKPEFSEDHIGVTHGDDLLYLLTISSISNANDEKTMETMVKMWSSFATDYKPFTGGVLGAEDWKPYSNQRQEYMKIAEDLMNMEGYEDRYTILVDDGNDNGGSTTEGSTTGSGSSTTEGGSSTTEGGSSTTEGGGSSTTEGGGSSTTEGGGTTSGYLCDCDELSDIEDERKAYLISMIVFIIAFVITVGISFFIKIRK